MEPSPLNRDVKESLQWLLKYFSEAEPRVIECSGHAEPIHLFTDGACEPEMVTVGAVLLEGGRSPEAFGGEVPEAVVERWRAGRSWQVVAQAELAPVFLAAMVWAERLRGKHLIVWIDQNAARQGLVKGYSPSEMSAELIDHALEALSQLGVYVWFTRVPTEANVADFPSRLQWDRLEEVAPGTVRRDIPVSSWARLV